MPASDPSEVKQRTPVKRTTTRLKTEKKAFAALTSGVLAATTTNTTTAATAVPDVPSAATSPLFPLTAAAAATSPASSSPTKVKMRKVHESLSTTREDSATSSAAATLAGTAAAAGEQGGVASMSLEQKTEEPQPVEPSGEAAAPAAEKNVEGELRRSVPPDGGDSDSGDSLDDSTSSSSASGGSHRGPSAPGSVRRAPELVTSLAGKRHTRVVMNPPGAAFTGGGGNGFFASLTGPDGAPAVGVANGRQSGVVHGASGRRGGGGVSASSGGASAGVNGGHHHNDSTLRYRTDLDKQVIHFMFERFHQEQVCPSTTAPVGSSGCGGAEVTDGSAPSTAAAGEGVGEAPLPPSVPAAAANAAANAAGVGVGAGAQPRARRTAVEEIFVPPNGEGEDKNIGLGDWHFFWMHVGRVRHTICSSDFRWQDQQIINHFPDHAELTRKDLMYKNIKRYLRENQANNYARLTLHTSTDWVSAAAFAAPAGTGGEAAGTPTAAMLGSGSGGFCTTSFCFADGVPITYNIPNDMSMFKEECQRQRGTQWIVKPTSRSQGKGIFIIDEARALQRWVREKKDMENMTSFLATGPAKRSTWVAPSVLQQQRIAQQNLTEAAAGGSGGGGGGGGNTPPPGSPTSLAPGVGAGGGGGAAAALTPPTLPTSSGGGGGGALGAYVVSRYISNPLLIGGKKFDLRLYVLVTSYKPLVAYLHEDGFARFCATRYNAGSLAQADLGSHLTNVALQKGDEHYNTSHSGKWSFQNLFLYVQSRYGPYAAEGMMKNIQFLIFHSLKAVEAVMFNDKHCFELYGYDILIDDQIKPHLIEVNASPSMSTTTVSDRLLKEQVLTDAMKIIFPPGFPTNNKAMPYWEYRQRTDLTTQQPTGFKLLQF